MRGVIIYEGPSVLNNEPIVAIATFDSRNVKTGNMIQTWIMYKDLHPLIASASKADEAVCGQCPRRHSLAGDCYVVIAQAPSKVWRAFSRGVYPPYVEGVHARYFECRSLRLGSYGDPSAVPYESWAPLVRLASAHTGYTHQASHRNFDRRIAEFCMVSADTAPQAERFQRDGFATYRVLSAGEPPAVGEVECRFQASGKFCSSCLLCSGIGGANIFATEHGSRSKVRAAG